MLQGIDRSRETSGALLPHGVRRAMLAVVLLMLVGAGWLAYVRGPAILLDLSGMASLFCL